MFVGVLLGLGFLTDGLKVPRRKFLAATLLVSGTLTWFFLLNFSFFDIFGVVVENDPLWAYNVGTIFFYGFAIFSAIVGSFVAKKINRTNLLLSWIAIGVFATVSLMLFQGTVFLVVSSLVLGLSLGFGLPSSMAFITECTVVEERARISGAIILVTFILGFTTLAVIRILHLDVASSILLFAAVRAVSFFALTIDKCDGKDERVTGKPRLPTVAYKEFLYYLSPWIMFCVAAGLASNLIPNTAEYESAISLGTYLRYVCIAVFGLLSGIIADRIGRKQPIIIGLIMLGVSFALLGFNMSPNTVLIYLTISGVAWGAFFVIFLTIPGDLSVRGTREKFYAIGYILPLAILFALSAIPGIAIFSTFSASSFAQILSIILFVAIIPVLRAKETLPSRKVDERKMKEHLAKLGKAIKETKDA
jgi:MFS family permease